MNHLSLFRNLYTPMQPSVNRLTENVSYQEFLPTGELQNYIYCYWQLQSTSGLKAAFNYRVVADGCIDIYFDLNQLNESYVMGFCKKFTTFPLLTSFNYFGIRFFPSMFPQLFKVDAKTLSNKYNFLYNINTETSNFIKHELAKVASPKALIKNLDHFFIQRIAQTPVQQDFQSCCSLPYITNTHICSPWRML